MSISELTISWRTDAGTHTLRLDPSGIPSVDGVEPENVSAPRRPGPARRGKAWTPEEEEVIRLGFTAGEATATLAERVGRSPGAVTGRLVQLGLIDAEAAGLRYPVQRRAAG